MISTQPIKKILVTLYNLNKGNVLNKKVKGIKSAISKNSGLMKPSADIEKSYKKLWKPLSPKANSDWLYIYINISGVSDYRFIPEDIYYNHVEPCLNNRVFSSSYTDKNFYDQHLADFTIPYTLLRNREGIFYTNNNKLITSVEALNQLDGEKRIIIKPAVESGGGKGVSLWEYNGENFLSEDSVPLTISYLNSVYRKNYIIQRAIEQPPFYEKYNPTSLNTIRVLTYRSVADEQIHFLQVIMRVGKTGSITDNQASGGYACGISPEGTLSGIAVDKMGNIYNEINGIGLAEGLHVEGLSEILETARKVAGRFHYSRLLGLDLCLNKEGKVVLIEVNNINNEINFFQMLQGPLFGEYTEEVVEFCSSNSRSIVFDFEI